MGRTVLVAALIAMAVGCDSARLATTASEGEATVVRVVDGDTLVADFAGREEKVRLIGIDTPESVKPNTPVECFGKEASHHLEDLLPEGTAIRVERDVEARDEYGRLLGYVYRSKDDLFVNRAQTEDGFADLLTFPPNVAHTDDFTAAVAAARAANRGLWASCPDPE
jgi:micrococcal nuclease